MRSTKPLKITRLIENLVIPETQYIKEAQRIFHGRGHAYQDLSHINLDWMQPLILVTLFAPVADKDLQQLCIELKKKFEHCKSIQVQHRYQSNWVVECIYGEEISQLQILENTLHYNLEIKSGVNTGLFLDMRNGRDWVQKNSKNVRVLNLFSYTCGFSVAAAGGGAKSIFNIDISRPFLNRGRENHHINQHSLDSIRFEKLNILKSFGRIKRHAPYDLIICDPPTFQKGSIDIVRDYPKLIRRCIEFMSDNAMLFLCINSPHIGAFTGKEFLLDAVRKNAPNINLIKEIKPPDVFKETQGKGSQVLIFKG